MRKTTLRSALKKVLKEENKEVLDQEIEALGLNVLKTDGEKYTVEITLLGSSVTQGALLLVALPDAIEETKQRYLESKQMSREIFNKIRETQEDTNDTTEVM